MKKNIILILILLVPFFTKAQTIFSAAYETGLPVGETNDYIGAFSGRGVTFLDIRAFVNPNLTLGGAISWQVLYEEKTGTFTNEEQQTITGTTKRYINSFPFMAHAHYYFGQDDGSPNPYAGLGLGAFTVEQRTEAGLFSSTTDEWHFGIVPEVGILFPTTDDTAVILKVKYNHAFENGGNVGPYQYFNFGLGFAWY